MNEEKFQRQISKSDIQNISNELLSICNSIFDEVKSIQKIKNLLDSNDQKVINETLSAMKTEFGTITEMLGDTRLYVGVTGEFSSGKSTFLNAYLQRNAFQSSDSPDSCTKITSVESNVINNKILKAIDTPGIKDTDNTDQENVKQLVEFLLNYEDGVNAVAIVLNGQNDKFTKDTEKFIKIAHQMFNHPDFWEH